MGSLKKQQFCTHFHSQYLLYCYIFRRMLFTYRVFILFIFGSIGASSCNIFFRIASLHVRKDETYFQFELIPPSLIRRHQLCIYGKLVRQMPLLLNPDTILLFFVKISHYHASSVISNASFFDNYTRALSIINLSIVHLSIVLNGLNTVMCKGYFN